MPRFEAAAARHCERCAPVVRGFVCVSADNEPTERRTIHQVAACHPASAVDSTRFDGLSQSVNRVTPSAYVVRGS